MSFHLFRRFQEWRRRLSEHIEKQKRSKKHEEALMTQIERILTDTHTKIPTCAPLSKTAKRPRPLRPGHHRQDDGSHPGSHRP